MLGSRERHRAADPELHLAGPNPPAAPDALASVYRDRGDGGTGLERQATDASPGRAQGARSDSGPLGEDADGPTPLEHDPGRLHRGLVGLAAADRERPDPGEDPALPASLEQLDLGDVLH